MNNTTIPDLKSAKKKSKIRETVEAILIAFTIAIFIRSFGIEAFKIPSESMIPTLLVGDHIFVNKFIYGPRIPLTKTRIIKFSAPKRGDVVVFIYPGDAGKNIIRRRDFIKRVIGLPGDEIRVEGKNIYINGERVPSKQLFLKQRTAGGSKLDVEGSDEFKTIPWTWNWDEFDYFEQELGDSEFITRYKKYGYHPEGTYVVPDGHLFVMGDNRDDSDDSRSWGFVPMENLKGKAMFVWLSLKKGGIRFDRFGKWID